MNAKLRDTIKELMKSKDINAREFGIDDMLKCDSLEDMITDIFERYKYE